MNTNYTEAAKDRCLGLLDTDIDAIWQGIEDMPENSDAKKWKKKFQSIASEYILSSRFALMRIFQKQCLSEQEIDKNDHAGFEVTFTDGSVGKFQNISVEHASSMESEQLKLYEKLMMDRASERFHADSQSDSLLIQKALQNHTKKTTMLSREEALTLGHTIGLTLEEMEWFLLRVFNVDGGLRYNSSDDLIDAYVFLRDSQPQIGMTSNELKEIYLSKYDSTEKIPHDEKTNWTMDNGNSLSDNITKWSSTEQCDDQFMEWIGSLAPHLDFPSETALRIYRNLAAYIYDIIEQLGECPNVNTLKKYEDGQETDFYHCINGIINSKGYTQQAMDDLFQGYEIDEKKCKKVADCLQKNNRDMTISDDVDSCDEELIYKQEDAQSVWHTIDVQKNKLTVNGGINADRKRVMNLLSGKEPKIEKCDILFLLWVIANYCWYQSESLIKTNTLAKRLFDFIDLAENALNKARLPAFYPPHLMEQSMLLSIVYAYANPDKKHYSPSMVYEQICNALIERRNKKTTKEKTTKTQ